jgi:hypothetical protein
MVLLEPKDRVHYRWLGGELARGRIGGFLFGLQGWMMSYLSTLIVAVALIILLCRADLLGDAAAVATALAFLTRDIGIFVLFQTFPGRRRGDFAAVAVLFALYALIPAILRGLGLEEVLAFFLPLPTRPIWMGPAVVWAEALAVAVLALSRVALSDKPAAAPA